MKLLVTSVNVEAANDQNARRWDDRRMARFWLERALTDLKADRPAGALVCAECALLYLEKLKEKA